jgi:hypothetical protein
MDKGAETDGTCMQPAAAPQWSDRDIKGSGTEYGKGSMQSKSMRRLGLHRKGEF